MLKRKIEQIISEKFDIPIESVASVPCAELVGNSILNIDGCMGIKKYTEEEIIIRTKNHILSISGESLSMVTFSQGRVCIRGVIIDYHVETVGKYE